MPELPDVTVYTERIEAHLGGHPLTGVRIPSAFLVRSVEPRPAEVVGKVLLRCSRLGKRIVMHFEDDLAFVIHLMIAGRLRWRKPGAAIPRKGGLAAFDFDRGTLLFTEAATRKRASLHVVRGEDGVAAHDPGGIDPLAVGLEAFAAAITEENHTLKRTLTDPRILSGIGNAYSDEILHRAGLSPLTWSTRLSPDEMTRLHGAVREILVEWTDRLRAEVGDGFPEKVTAFHPGMAVHGKYRRPCPVCSTPVQRIAYASNETNYCPTCQTGGKLLADRALSRLLRGDWPRTLEELEAMKSGRTSRKDSG